MTNAVRLESQQAAIGGASRCSTVTSQVRSPYGGSWSAPVRLSSPILSHVVRNRPFYERLGFSVVSEQNCGPEMRQVLREERGALPKPEARVAMRIRV